MIQWLWLLIGCPEPIDYSSRKVDNGSTSAASSAPSTGGAGGPNSPGEVLEGTPADGTEGAPPMMGTFPAELPESETNPQYTQAQLADGAEIRGIAECSNCPGKLLVRALPPPPDDPSTDDGSGMQLIAQVSIDGPGAFSIRVPNKSPVTLQVVDDNNGDGVPSQGERMGMPSGGSIFADGVVEGITLVVGAFPQKEPVEGIGIIPTPPLPGEAGEGGAEMDGPPVDGAPSGDGPMPTMGNVQDPSMPPSGNPDQAGQDGQPLQPQTGMTPPPGSVTPPPEAPAAPENPAEPAGGPPSD